MQYEPQRIPLQRIFLDVDNPRHEPLPSQSDAIEWLCSHESVLELATDIEDIGINALELFALIPHKVPVKTKVSAYIAAEGNRRLCALKLLHDPELAPSSLRAEFRKLSKKVTIPSTVFAIIYPTRKEANPWLERLHNGNQNGIGRVQWDAEQKARHFGKSRNSLALAVLDLAEKRNFISKSQRRGKLTTAQRYLSNEVVRESLGIAGFEGDSLLRTRPVADVDLLLQQFVNDLIGGEVNSRANQKEVEAYGAALANRDDISGEITGAVKLVSRSRRKPRPPHVEPEKAVAIGYDGEIASSLEALGNYKLKWLYYSLHTVGLENNVPLLSVGVWSFFETLSAAAGRNESASFPSFLSTSRIAGFGISQRETQKAITQVISHISSWGNTTKHHAEAANFNGEQLANDMKILSPVIKGLIALAQAENGATV